MHMSRVDAARTGQERGQRGAPIRPALPRPAPPLPAGAALASSRSRPHADRGVRAARH